MAIKGDVWQPKMKRLEKQRPQGAEVGPKPLKIMAAVLSKKGF